MAHEQEIKRFWKKVNKKGPLHPVLKSRCWEWTAAKDGDGYGKCTYKGQWGSAHRAAYDMMVGEIGQNIVCHRCDNPSCVRPIHLFLGTVSDNNADMQQKGRLKIAGNAHKKGEDNSASKLTEAQVREIRARYIRGKHGYKKLAQEFSISPQHVRSIVTGESWSHI